MNVVIKKPNEQPYLDDIPNTLQALQKVVGGYIEIVHSPLPGICFIINEEGKLLSLDNNIRLIDYDGVTYDVLSGTAIAAADCEELASLSDDQVELAITYMKMASV